MRQGCETPIPNVANTRSQGLKLEQFRWNCAALAVLIDGWLLSLLLKANFDPTQPRLPRGASGGGRWTNGGQQEGVSEAAPVRIAQSGPRPRADETNPSFLVDLRDHEGVNGGHAIEKHVGKSDTYLYNRMLGEKFDGKWVSMGLARSGSFDNIVAANKLVSATLAKNRAIVERVGRGESKEELITATFGYRTGREFYRDIAMFSFFRPKDIIRLRDVNGVGVIIRHDPSAVTGFTIFTAYPRTDD